MCFAVSKHFSDDFISMNKRNLRHHISGLCKIDLCVDSLVVYMNGPSLADGSILLKDIDQNGLVSSESHIDQHRVYTDYY